MKPRITGLEDILWRKGLIDITVRTHPTSAINGEYMRLTEALRSPQTAFIATDYRTHPMPALQRLLDVYPNVR